MEQPNEYVQAPTPEAPSAPFIPVSGEEMTGWNTYFSEENLNYYYRNMQTLIAAPYEMTSTVVEGMLDLKKIAIDKAKTKELDLIKSLIEEGLASRSLSGDPNDVVTSPSLTSDPATGETIVVEPGEPPPPPLDHGPQPPPPSASPDQPASPPLVTPPVIRETIPGMNIDLSLPTVSEAALESDRGSGKNLANNIIRTGFGYGAASTAIALSAMGSVESSEVKEDINNKLLNQIKSNEGMKLEPYRQGEEKYYTIGVGHYLDGSPGSRKLIATILPKVKYKDIQEGRVSLTKTQAEQLMVLDIKERRKQTIKVLEGGKYKWEELPQDLRNHLIDATFRGSFIPMKNEEGQQIGSPDTIKFIKQGKFREAAKEFIDRRDYRKAKKTGVNRGIIKRMDAIHDALIRAAEYFEKQGA